MSDKKNNKPQFRVELFSADTKEELSAQILSKSPDAIPVTDVIEVELSKLGNNIENGYLQFFARLSDYAPAEK